jgi:hypothetical protein
MKRFITYLQDPVIVVPRMNSLLVQMITEVYFIEGLYLYKEVGSSGRGVLASSVHRYS